MINPISEVIRSIKTDEWRSFFEKNRFTKVRADIKPKNKKVNRFPDFVISK